jgi:hypothetical protein
VSPSELGGQRGDAARIVQQGRVERRVRAGGEKQQDLPRRGVGREAPACGRDGGLGAFSARRRGGCDPSDRLGQDP